MAMVRTSLIALLGVVSALLVADKVSRSSHDEDLARQIKELKAEQAELIDNERTIGEQQAKLHARMATDRAEARRDALAAEARRAEAAEGADVNDANKEPEGDEERAEGERAEKPEAEAPRTVQEMSASLDATFASERPDATWSADAQSRAQSGLSRALPSGSSVRSVRCTSSMCRIETRHHDMDEYQQFVDRAFVQPSTALWNAGFFSSVVDGAEGGGEVTVVSFLARDEQPLAEVSRRN